MRHERTAVVVEDDADIAEVIGALLDQVGFEVQIASTGAEALSVIRDTRPDLVTLDLTLPDFDGVEVCRQIRMVSDCYVMVVSARTAEVDRLVGLEVGADDYLSKPFSLRELQARVAALFRRPRSVDGMSPAPAPVATPAASTEPVTVDGVLGCSDLQLFRQAREVRVAGEQVELTRTEFDLLTALATRPGVVMRRNDLLREVWETEHATDTHLVDVHVANVRRKLREHGEARWIRTVRGVGFRFDAA